MPIYEYLCEDCKKTSSHLVLKPSDFSPFCKYCGGRNVKRIISRVVVIRSEESKIERLTDPSRWGDLEGDPRALGRWMKEVSGEFGEGEVSPDEIDQMVEEAVRGEADTSEEGGE